MFVFYYLSYIFHSCLYFYTNQSRNNDYLLVQASAKFMSALGKSCLTPGSWSELNTEKNNLLQEQTILLYLIMIIIGVLLGWKITK